MEPVTLHIRGLRARGGLNAREVWQAAHSRKRRERNLIYLHFAALPNTIRCQLRRLSPVAVRLTRCSPASVAMDGDNLAGTLKAIRDEVARCLGRDDADSQVHWIYAQERSEWGVRVEIFEDQGVPGPRPGLQVEAR